MAVDQCVDENMDGVLMKLRVGAWCGLRYGWVLIWIRASSTPTPHRIHLFRIFQFFIFIIETVSVVYFTFEFILRLASAASYRRFVFSL